MDVEYLWATPLFTSSISESLRASTASSVLSLRGVPDVSGNWCSHDRLHAMGEFAELTSSIIAFAEECCDSLSVKRDSLYISAMWANTAPLGVAHMTHRHPNCMYSGLIYLQAPPGAEGTVFTDPRPASTVLRPSYSNPSPLVIGQDYKQVPTEGKMLLWPAWLEHGVMSGAHDPLHTRVSLSYNIMLRASMGENTYHLDTRSLG
jgi:uncharacterized protein (TIGR02466 family)